MKSFSRASRYSGLIGRRIVSRYASHRHVVTQSPLLLTILRSVSRMASAFSHAARTLFSVLKFFAGITALMIAHVVMAGIYLAWEGVLTW